MTKDTGFTPMDGPLGPESKLEPKKAPLRLKCRDCERTTQDESTALREGWTFLSIAGGCRCPVCVSVLRKAGGIAGTTGLIEPDLLSPDSRGALPKETASTITPPAKGIS